MKKVEKSPSRPRCKPTHLPYPTTGPSPATFYKDNAQGDVLLPIEPLLHALRKPLQLKHNGNFPSQGNPLLEVSGNGNTAAYNNSRSHCVIGCSLSITILFFRQVKLSTTLPDAPPAATFRSASFVSAKGNTCPTEGWIPFSPIKRETSAN